MLTGHDWSVVGIGILTVFVGLICIIAICYLSSAFFRGKKESKAAAPAPQNTAVKATSETSADIPNRREFIAAVSVTLAEELGTDVRAIRIISVKKL